MVRTSPRRLGNHHNGDPGRQGEWDNCRGEQLGLHGSHRVLQINYAAFYGFYGPVAA